MSNVWKFVFVIFVTSLSGLVSAEAVVTVADHDPAPRAASAQAAISQAAISQAAISQAAISQANAEAAQGGQRATIAKSADGHYWANGQVNGASVRFLVDTGASAVSLTPDDARRLGFDVGALHYVNRVITADGQARAAAVKLASLTVSGARLENVEALVIEKGLDTSLLGMTYLGRLASFQATRQALILRP